MAPMLETLRRRWLFILSVATMPLWGMGCAVDAGTSAEDVTDIANSKVKDQSIGNCWIYASVGWVEALRLTHSGEELNLSESYVTYWHWFEQIRGGAPGQKALATMETKDGVSQLSTGGWWVTATEIMRRYGLVEEGIFIPAEAEQAASSRQSSAESAINTSLRSGVLQDAAARADAATVRAELDKAWQLTPEVIALLDQIFGKGIERTLYDSPTIPAGSGLRTVQSLAVGHDGNGKTLTLADAVGEPVYSYWGVGSRQGTYAWNEQSYPLGASPRRQFQIKVQDAMHRRLPAIMTWYVDFAALENDNTFRTPPATPGRQGGHMTVLEDYEIENVPGYGVLPAGQLVTDPAILQAALSPEAKIRFFRIKNSWGSSLSPDPNQGDALKGYYDLWMTYLDADLKKTEGGTVPGLTGAVLPPSTFQSGGGQPENPPPPDPTTGCAHELCVTGAALDPACDPCVAQIAANDPFCVQSSWDDVCVGQVASVCGQTCP
jgi:hypothetical protein